MKIEPTETVIGVRTIKSVTHVWLLDSRTTSARRIQVHTDAIPSAWRDCLKSAHEAILDVLKASDNGF